MTPPPLSLADKVAVVTGALLDQYPDLGLLYEYEQAEPCGAYDALDRAISSLTYRSPTSSKDPA
jgi:hypothetical protein